MTAQIADVGSWLRKVKYFTESGSRPESEKLTGNSLGRESVKPIFAENGPPH